MVLIDMLISEVRGNPRCSTRVRCMNVMDTFPFDLNRCLTSSDWRALKGEVDVILKTFNKKTRISYICSFLMDWISLSAVVVLALLEIFQNRGIFIYVVIVFFFLQCIFSSWPMAKFKQAGVEVTSRLNEEFGKVFNQHEDVTFEIFNEYTYFGDKMSYDYHVKIAIGEELGGDSGSRDATNLTTSSSVDEDENEDDNNNNVNLESNNSDTMERGESSLITSKPTEMDSNEPSIADESLTPFDISFRSSLNESPWHDDMEEGNKLTVEKSDENLSTKDISLDSSKNNSIYKPNIEEGNKKTIKSGKKCKQCGEYAEKRVKFCTNCGKKL